MPDQPKTPLKVGQSGCNFHRKLSLYQRMILYRAAHSRATLEISISGCGGPHTTPQVEDVRYVIILLPEAQI